MKYIAFFDVPDETTPIDDTAELVCCGKVSEVYAKVKPYNPSGDLISREDLKKAFKIEELYWGKRIIDEIDNAPTVAINCKDCDGYEAGYSAGLNDAERPKGEWIVIHNALGETKYQCNQCQHYVEPSDDKNFCPNCGADMRGGTE